MNKIDLALHEAWMRVGALCRDDPREALRRAMRFRRASVSAPVRQWCLCLRSSDTRIDSHNAIIEPLPGELLNRDTGTDDIVHLHVPHRVTLDGRMISTLTQPVRIPWPGVPLWEAEKKLGMSRDFARAWMRRGVLKVSRHDYCRMHGKVCKPIPIVYTPRFLDTNMQKGQSPDGIWGSLWHLKSEQLPAEFVMRAARMPRLQPRQGTLVFRGWDWVCPGRLAADGCSMLECGRRCSYLYAPLPPVTLAQSICEWALAMPEESGLAGTWHPGLQHAKVGEGRRTFACKHCWGVRNPSMLKHVGWNEFVSYISGGLLYGHEVARPEDEAPYLRKHAWGKRRARKVESRKVAAAAG